jgi:hypothetical protein
MYEQFFVVKNSVYFMRIYITHFNVGVWSLAYYKKKKKERI